MKCFRVFVNEIEGRLDPLFYDYVYLANDKKIRESEWPVEKLKNITEKIVDGPFGSQLKVEEYRKHGIPLVRVSNVRTGEIEGNFVFISEDKQEQLKRSRVLPNDVLLTKAGAILGYSAVFPKHLIEGNITSHLVTIRCRRNILPEYLSIFFRTSLGQLQVYRWGNKSTRPELNTAEVKQILVPVPPCPTQNRIVQFMDNAYEIKKQKEIEAQQLIDTINDYVLEELSIKLPELKDEMTFVVYADEIEGRIDPFYYRPGIKEIKRTLEQKYGTHFLGEVIKDIYRYPTFYGIRYLSKGIRVIKGESISKEGIIEDEQDFDYIDEDTHKRFIKTHIKKGDLIFTVRGIIGKIGYYNLNDEANINANVIKIRLINNYNPEFFWIYLNSKIGQLFIDTSSSGQVQKTITVPDIKNIPIPLLPLSIQNKIADEVKVRMQKAKQLQKEAKERVEEAKERVERIILGDEEI